jgi:hypothetical protein
MNGVNAGAIQRCAEAKRLNEKGAASGVATPFRATEKFD